MATHETKNISELSVVELKSLCYDHLVNIENSQKSLQVLNAEIAKRQTIEIPKGEAIA